MIRKFLMSILVVISCCEAGNQVPAKSLQNFSHLKEALTALFPREDVHIKTIKNSIILTGLISSGEVAEKIESIAQQFIQPQGQVLNFMKLKTCQQVLLKVRIGEVDRDNVQIIASGRGQNIDQLQQKGLIRMLAEPNLVSISGEEAEFSSGGELPISTKESDNSTKYKPFGIKVSFTPLVLAPNRIRLKVEPELSHFIDSKTSSSLPQFTHRKAKTTVELAPGESFMIAGLIQDFYINDKRSSKELVISVTPYLVDPMHNKNMRMPTDNIYIHNRLENRFIENLFSDKKQQTSNKVSGPVGFIVD